jgi:thioredoxin-dependent peroxiredoxin
MTDATNPTATATPAARPMPAAGEPAPDIALPGDDGVLHRLADRRGQWTVVYFYPKDDTPGCTTEACEFRDSFASLRADGAEVWGISPNDVRSHARFREKFSLPFTLLADAGALVAKAYGAWVFKNRYGRTYMGVQRSTFLVGPDGVIARAWHQVKPEGHAADVRAQLAAARAESRD